MNNWPSGESKVEDPQQHVCTVWGYIFGHSQMFLEVYPEWKREERFYLLFSDVLYFEGPMKWQGSGFRFGTPVEQKNLYNRMSGEKLETVWNAWNQTHRLYILDNSRFHVYILASGIFISKSSAPPLSYEVPQLLWERVQLPTENK